MKKTILWCCFIFLFQQLHALSKEKTFWKWFEKHEAALFKFEENQETLFKELEKQLHVVHPNITFEFGAVKDNKREFVISADGLLGTFPSVEKLYNQKPELEKWIFIKFRPRRDLETTIIY